MVKKTKNKKSFAKNGKTNGLTAKKKKLPKSLQAAILKAKKKKRG